MRHVEFRRLLDNDNALRVRFDLEHGEVLMFVVQLECLFDDIWTPVMRYDTAHGFAHRDRIHPRKPAEKTELQVKSYKEGLNFAMTIWKPIGVNIAGGMKNG